MYISFFKPRAHSRSLIHDLLSKFLHHYFSLVPLFVFCTIICSILNSQFSISILYLEFFFSFCKLEFSMSHIGNFTFKSERSIFQIGTFYFSNWNFLFFNKFVLNSPVISRHNKLDKSKCVFKNPVHSCHLNKGYNFCKRFPAPCVPSTFTFNPWIQSRIMSENKLSIEHQHDNKKLLISSKKRLHA